MTLVKYDPFRTLLRWPSVWDDEDWGLTSVGGTNQLDVYETENEVVIRASVAGVPEDKVDISFEKGILTIAGQSEQEEKDEQRKYYQKATRSYSYRVAVPGNIDLKAEPVAEVENGVVEITFAKAEEEKPRRIQAKRKTTTK